MLGLAAALLAPLAVSVWSAHAAFAERPQIHGTSELSDVSKAPKRVSGASLRMEDGRHGELRDRSPQLHSDTICGLADTDANGSTDRSCPSDNYESWAPLTRVASSTEPMRFTIPVCRSVSTQLFGYSRDPFEHKLTFHSGIDLATDLGVPVRAGAAGRVTVAEAHDPYGLLVEIDHGGDYYTRYGHLKSVGVHVDEMVGRGQVVGSVGTSGKSTGPHVHFEVWYHNEARNPLKYLERDPACTIRRFSRTR